MSTNKKVSTMFEIEKTEHEETMKMNTDELESETLNSIDIKL